MKLRNVTYNDEEMPETVTFEMTVDEAALVYAFVGRVAPGRVSDAAGGDTKWGGVLLDVAECLSGAFFNRHWDNGAGEVAPRINPSVGGSQ